MTRFAEKSFPGPAASDAAGRDRHAITFEKNAGAAVPDYTCPKCNAYNLRDLEVIRHCTACGWEGVKP